MQVLLSQPDMRCFSPEWNRLVPVAIVGLLAYGVGYPIFLLRLFHLVRVRVPWATHRSSHGVDALKALVRLRFDSRWWSIIDHVPPIS
eukprot:7018560-Pyramimonas_sp.AAC.1